MNIGDLVKGKYKNKDQYGLVMRFFRHWEGNRLIYAAQVSWDCGEINWFHIDALEVA